MGVGAKANGCHRPTTDPMGNRMGAVIGLSILFHDVEKFPKTTFSELEDFSAHRSQGSQARNSEPFGPENEVSLPQLLSSTSRRSFAAFLSIHVRNLR